MNRVGTICVEDGKRYDGSDVPDQFVNHFNKFLGASLPVIPLHTLGNIVNMKLTSEEAEYMVREVTDEEIKYALFEIDSSKAAGLYGYSAYFYKKAWQIVGNEICLAVREFFRTGKILGEINATLIALVPKIDTPNVVSDFKPIACCNVLYKIISKILTDRIKRGLNKIVNLNQSAFIPGRHIQDNILIAQELLRGYNRKSGARRCDMKIDLQKAYDTINWEFLKDVLHIVGFHEAMINWIMTCITSTSFFICVNGEVKGFFKGGRGLRQGDPISPYLFTLVMEVFNMIMINNINQASYFRYHYGCSELKLTHMCFVDDLLVMCNDVVESLKVVKKSIDEFSKVFGLYPNLNKSTIFFGVFLTTIRLRCYKSSP
ncbi:RNA-directed DNA polymerase, eukaryota, reverse transcriptase zinc-binding domain protein [Tanacetum coccineum]